MSRQRGRRSRRGVAAMVGVGATLAGCNALFGIDDAEVTPPGAGAGGSAGSGGGAGASGAAAGQGGQGAPGGGGRAGAPPTPFDDTFGVGGKVTLPLGDPAATGAAVFAVGRQRDKIFVAGAQTIASAAVDGDTTDLFFARVGPDGAPDATFGAFAGTAGLVRVDRGNVTDRLNAVYLDPNSERAVYTAFASSYDPAVPATASENRNAMLLPDGSDDPGFFDQSYATDATDAATEAIVPGAPGYLIVRCNDFIDFQRVELWRFASDGPVDDDVPSMIDAMPTRLSCPARPVPTPDGGGVCLALSSVFEAGPADGKVGAACIRTNQSVVSSDPAFGGKGHFVFTPPALDPLPQQFTVWAYELAFDAAGRLYEAFTAGSHSFVARVLADGSNVDAGFGAAGVVHVGEGDRPPWCLQVDARGRTFWGGTLADRAVLLRYAPDGAPDLTFGAGGRLEFEAPFAPQRCALDAESRLVVAGATPGAADPPSLTLVRLHNAD